MPAALPELVPLALLLIAFGIVWAARKLLAAMFGSLIDAVNSAHIPYLGAAIQSALHAMEQAVSNALGSVEHGIDSLIGSCWHRFAELNHWLWSEFRQHTLIGWLTAQLISELAHGYHYLHGRVTDLTGSHTQSAARIKTLEREYHGIEAKVKTLERDYAHGIGSDVLPRIKTLEREASRIENVQLPAAIAAQRQADSAISNLYEWAKGKASLLGVGTFTLAVATALDALGLDWLACRSRSSVNGKAGCALWNDIESLLGAAIVTGLALDLPALIGEAQKVTPGIIAGIEDLAGLGR